MTVVDGKTHAAEFSATASASPNYPPAHTHSEGCRHRYGSDAANLSPQGTYEEAHGSEGGRVPYGLLSIKAVATQENRSPKRGQSAWPPTDSRPGPRRTRPLTAATAWYRIRGWASAISALESTCGHPVVGRFDITGSRPPEPPQRSSWKCRCLQAATRKGLTVSGRHQATDRKIRGCHTGLVAIVNL